MHPDRLNFLAYRHKQRRAVVSQDVRKDGTTLTLECGHFQFIAPHFDTKHKTESGCAECGRDYVKSAPEFAAEFDPIPLLAALTQDPTRPQIKPMPSRIVKTVRVKK